MVKKLLIVLVLISVLVPAVYTLAQTPDEETLPSPVKKYQFGARMGPWFNLGDTAITRVLFVDELGNTVAEMETNINDVNFYFEGYFAYNIFPGGFAELSVGIVNRGSVSIRDAYSTDIGNLILYPFLLQLKYYPLPESVSRFRPYVAVGGGLYYGRQDIQFTTSPFLDQYYQGESETDFNYTLCGGIDYALRDFLALDLSARYMPIDFPDLLILMRDYDALAITVGIKYLYGGKK